MKREAMSELGDKTGVGRRRPGFSQVVNIVMDCKKIT